MELGSRPLGLPFLLRYFSRAGGQNYTLGVKFQRNLPIKVKRFWEILTHLEGGSLNEEFDPVLCLKGHSLPGRAWTGLPAAS